MGRAMCGTVVWEPLCCSASLFFPGRLALRYQLPPSSTPFLYQTFSSCAHLAFGQKTFVLLESKEHLGVEVAWTCFACSLLMTVFSVVLLGYCDIVGEWQKYRNKRFVTISKHFLVLLIVIISDYHCIESSSVQIEFHLEIGCHPCMIYPSKDVLLGM